jgi:uncharacterized protein (TIGR02145 family)
MAENLKTTHYPNGNVIPLVTDNTTWGNLGDNNTDDAYCYYNNNANNEADTYGALYTYAAAKDACPTGWHLPSDAEWTTLKNYISAEGHNGIEGTTLKAIAGWNNNGNGTNNYDFSALPGGHRARHRLGSANGWRHSRAGFARGKEQKASGGVLQSCLLVQTTYVTWALVFPS